MRFLKWATIFLLFNSILLESIRESVYYHATGYLSFKRIPLFNRRNRFQELLQSSLYDKNNVKKILSEKGNEQLKVVKFRSDKFDTNECVITQDEFEEGEEIIC